MPNLVSPMRLIAISVALLLAGCIEINAGGKTTATPERGASTPTTPTLNLDADNGHLVTKLTLEMTRKDNNNDGTADVEIHIFGRDAEHRAWKFKAEASSKIEHKDGNSWAVRCTKADSITIERFRGTDEEPYFVFWCLYDHMSGPGSYRAVTDATITKTGTKESAILEFGLS